MLLNVVKSNLSKALNAVIRAVSTKPTIEVLRNIAIKAKNGVLTLSATDLEISITMSIGADIQKEGETTVLAKTFIDFISLLPEGNINISLENTELVVNAGKVNSKFATIPYEEFPSLNKVDDSSILLFSIDKNLFSEALDKVLFCVDRSGSSQPVFSGVFFEKKGNGVNLVSTDRFRLSKYYLNTDSAINLESSPVVPFVTLDNISRLSLENEEDDIVNVYISSKHNQIIFKNGRLEIVSGLIDGTFPNYDSFLPKERIGIYVVNKSNFIDVIRLSNVFGKNDETLRVLFKKDKGSNVINISTKVNEVGEYNSNIDVNVINVDDSFEVYFSPRKILDVLSRINTENVILEFVLHPKVNHKMLIFKEDSNDNFFHLLTPLVSNA